MKRKATTKTLKYKTKGSTTKTLKYKTKGSTTKATKPSIWITLLI